MPYANLQEYKDKAQYFELNGNKIAYWTSFAINSASDGSLNHEGHPTILFIHGFPGAAWDWHHQWQYLKNEFSDKINLIAFDLLGLGLSDKPVPHAYSLIEQTSIANNLITKLNIKHCHIIAHDYGDSVAQSLLHKYENKELSFTIDSICYLNGGLFAESHRPLLTQKLLKSKLGPFITKFMNKNSLRRSFKKIYNPAKPPSNQDIDCIWLLLNHNNGIAALHYLLGYIDERHLHRNNWVNSMQNTRVMQYFVNGMHDPISGQHMLDKFEKLVPNANAVGIDAGHYPQLESPDLINTIYLEFLNRVLSKAQSADI